MRDGRGTSFGATAGFLLPNGAECSPDAAWVSKRQIEAIPKRRWRKFVHVVPEFIVEVMSPSERLGTAKAKMEEWIANGVQLGWLLDGDHRCVYIYKPGCKVEKRTGTSQLAGEGPVAGFILDLEDIWEGV